ncbi:hypothetical protein [Geothrix sp. 21YS21S-2]|uniref:hypothetical protein n=1 Tax=Geothrix sp. 21YS21S-2 TaxID=3068893 RepID=UPI0027B91497|nr:hypothetical protein [Geothrix sp. 21YS21S-2]
MAVLDACNLCGGMGFLRFPEGDRHLSGRCPACRGAGVVESWRQATAAGHAGWLCGPAHRLDGAEVRLTLRVRAEREFRASER